MLIFSAEGKKVGRVEYDGVGCLVVMIDKGFEIPEYRISDIFGKVDYEVLEAVEVSGCYQRIRSFRITSWDLNA